MAKKTTAKKGQAAESAERTPKQGASVSNARDVEGAIFKLKGLFTVMSAMGTGADTCVPSNDLAMLADLATGLLGEIEAYHFGHA